MFQELKFQLSTAILTLLTIAAAAAALINFQQLRHFRLPEDGVIWVDRNGAVEALQVPHGSPGAKADLHHGDLLKLIDGVPIQKSSDVTKVLANLGAWKKAKYYVSRYVSNNAVDFEVDVYIAEAPFDRALLYEYAVGAAYLLIGLFVYFRRGTAHKARHFYILCLASFIFFCFHYTGQLNGFDKIIYFGNWAAGLIAPAIFLHFCLTFPDPWKGLARPARAVLIYVPAGVLLAVFLGFTSGILSIAIPLVELRWVLDRIWVVFSTLPYLVGGIALTFQYRKAEDTIVRQQLKWLRNGTLCGILPFAILYITPYALGATPNEYLKMSVLSVALIPLTLAYAIMRYRLMDVDILFRRGYAYTLATVCVLAAFYGIVFSLGSLVQKNFKDLGNTGLITVMLITAFLFQPIRNWIQERLDKFFYRDQYDYRRTLIEFARELSSETDLDRMLSLVGERLLHTLAIRYLAFFLAEDPLAGRPEPSTDAASENGGMMPEAAASPAFRLRKAIGPNPRASSLDYEPDLSFLHWRVPEPYLFFERTRHQLDAISLSWPASIRRTIADLDLTYYLPCAVRGRTIAYMGVSRTVDGDYLSTVDVELLVTLAGYVGIAIENATLYRSLQRKVEEYERLKEFSENIVESINVGILAADLEDRVESWNSQMEQLTSIDREQALGKTLGELFPAGLVEECDRVRGETGIHNIYKFVLKAVHVNGNGTASIGSAGAAGPRRETTLNLAIAPLVSKEQRQIGRLIIFDDVTDRAELEQRLVQADKLSSIGLLAAGVAHEVNTPLAVISTYAQMLAKQVAGDTQKSIMLDKIAKQTFRASEIVNSLLNFSRTSTTSFAEVNLNRVVMETLSLVEHQMQKAGVLVKTSLEPEMVPIYGNTGKLQQVFLNLFLNARDAMQASGTLEIRTWSDGVSAKVEVADTGTGIAPEHLNRIYDPFFTTKAARKGTGLGLSVSYGIIQEHGGSIEVSNRPGGGARFRIDLPLAHGARLQKPMTAA